MNTKGNTKVFLMDILLDYKCTTTYPFINIIQHYIRIVVY